MTSDRPRDAWRFELYIAGKSRRSTLALENLQEICRDYLGSDCLINVIDMQEHPEKMAENKICVAPTLIRKFPEPERMLVGDLSLTERVLQGLDITGLPRATSRSSYRYGLSKQGFPAKQDNITR